MRKQGLVAPIFLALMMSNSLAQQLVKTHSESPLVRLPLQFEPNKGQVENSVRFMTHAQGTTIFLTDTEAVIVMNERGTIDRRALLTPAGRHRLREATTVSNFPSSAVVRMRLNGASSTQRIQGENRLPGIINYFIGNDSTQWHTKIPTFSRVRYQSVYDGIDLVYHSEASKFEFDFELQPQADPSRIELEFAGIEQMDIDGTGQLVMKARGSALKLQKPMVYQVNAGQKQIIDSTFENRGAGRVGLRLGNYDFSKPIVIDPVLVYSSYLGGSGDDFVSGSGMALDSQNNVYVTGGTLSSDFPTTGFGVAPSGRCVAFVTKLDPSASSIVYSDFVGGSSGDSSCTSGDVATAVAVDANGQAYLAGATLSHDFPVTGNALQSVMLDGASSNAFLSKLSQDGSSLVYSTFLGGEADDVATGIALDANQNAYLGGWTSSSQFPITANAFQGTRPSSSIYGNGFLSRIDTTKTGTNSLIYSSYLGGSGQSGEAVASLAVDSYQNAYLAGWTASADFPITSNSAFQQSINLAAEDWCGFVSRIDTSQVGPQSLAYSSFLCGTYDDWAQSIAIDSSLNAYVSSVVVSQDFPSTIGLANTRFPNDSMLGVTKVNTYASGLPSLVYSRLIGGSDPSKTNWGDWADGIAVDSRGHAYVTGQSSSSDYPTTADAVQTTLNSTAGNAILSVLSTDGATILYSTYLGGSGVGGDYSICDSIDSASNVWMAGYTTSSDFPVTAGAIQPSYGGNGDGFIGEISALSVPEIASVTPASGAAGTSVTITGSNFGSDVGSVSFGGTATSIQSWSASEIVFQIPNSVTAGAGAVVVTTALEPLAAGNFTVVVTPLIISATLPENAQLGTAYNVELGAKGGTPPYFWSVVSGALPDGLSLDPSSGQISGTPVSVTTVPFTVQVADSSSPAQNASQVFSIRVLLVPAILTITPSPTRVTVTPGQTAVFRLAFQGNTTEANAVVNISCEGLPEGASCSYSPVPFVLNSDGLGNNTVRVRTIGSPSTSTNKQRPVLGFIFLAPALIGMLSIGLLKEQPRTVLLLLLIGATIAGASSCAGSANLSSATSCSNCTPAGTFNVRIVATSQKPVLQADTTLQIQVVPH